VSRFEELDKDNREDLWCLVVLKQEANDRLIQAAKCDH
jgi:hypothetical protein